MSDNSKSNVVFVIFTPDKLLGVYDNLEEATKQYRFGQSICENIILDSAEIHT